MLLWMSILYGDGNMIFTAQISLTLSRHLTLSPIAPDQSSRLHPVSDQSRCIYVLGDCPAFPRPCEVVHWNMSLSSSSLLLQQSPEYKYVMLEKADSNVNTLWSVHITQYLCLYHYILVKAHFFTP